MLTYSVLRVCQILPHAVKLYSSDQTGVICPYAVTDVKAAGLRLYLAAAVRLPPEEGPYTHVKYPSTWPT